MITWAQIVFLLKGTHKDFEVIEKNDTGTPLPAKIKTGDLLMRKVHASGVYHVGVYCGKFVIEFTAPEKPTLFDQITSFSSTSESGTVNMKSLKNFIINKPYRVLRLRVAIPVNFSVLTDKAMDYDEKYHPLANNCLHFALKLLELGTRSLPRSLPKESAEEINMDDLEECAALTQ
ncbi:hypothetical protein G5714_017338 [Onychostoma macrolepis]|uniref:LRAT domain-containing protein n=1 Tax=Onychostoma macrolepis TaxID=369639 RepID=A0A7J6C5I7_9TELE|nr:hypothetical protein G5714_017338 [Onychostoma macrolepis]